MRVVWSAAAHRDLRRVYEFVKSDSPRAAARIVDMLDAAADRLPDYPEIGMRLEVYDPLHVRSLIVSDYEMRYEVSADVISIVRLWHAREYR